MGEITNFRGETIPASARSAPDHAVEELIARVGDRVRKARERKGIPRRVLSDMSGVSPRYLAQLESGAGNISIALLQRVADALDHRIEWLVAEEDPWNSEAAHIAQIFRTASREQRKQVLDILAPEPASALRAGRICLIGLRGSGKSTLGARAGEILGLPFVELNREIEEQAGMAVNEVMALYGQEGYRKLEAQALSRVIATHDSLMLAVAGGIVAEPDTFNLLLGRFHTVWLKAAPAEHMARVRAQGDTRPMAGNDDAMAQLNAILASREALYQRAEAQVNTSGKTVDEALAALLSVIAERGFLSR
ncbi:MAG: helix-turn-helix transcriptional regulator [Paracoccus sp. (in: a-proteobacteria)]|nr:helix-turn-helix transcriptional regulator [Paracoccus sp. (in: a-proteobacteria)]